MYTQHVINVAYLHILSFAYVIIFPHICMFFRRALAYNGKYALYRDMV